MKTQDYFPKYKLSKEEIEIVRHFKESSTFDFAGADDVTDKQSFVDCMNMNHRWLIDWAEDIVRVSRQKISELPYYYDSIEGV